MTTLKQLHRAAADFVPVAPDRFPGEPFAAVVAYRRYRYWFLRYWGAPAKHAARWADNDAEWAQGGGVSGEDCEWQYHLAGAQLYAQFNRIAVP